MTNHYIFTAETDGKKFRKSVNICRSHGQLSRPTDNKVPVRLFIKHVVVGNYRISSGADYSSNKKIIIIHNTHDISILVKCLYQYHTISSQLQRILEK